MKKSIVLGALSVGLACTAWASTAAELMPLSLGNYWVYREARTGETFTIRVGQPVALQSGNVYHYLIGYTASSYVLARIDTNGNLVALDEENGVETLLTGFAEPEGRWWPAPGRGECATVKQEGQTQEKRMQYDGPGGRWNGALEVRYQSPGGCADTGVLAEQFTENIGMLRRVVTTIAGPRTFDLVYARVGTQIIETRDRGRFSVAVDPPTEADDSLRVTLRVDLGFTSSIRLRFPSSQVFDVALRDAAGKVVWQWSEGRLFDQATREVNIGNVWNETVRVPRPAGAGELTGYTIEGWLTTLPGEPRFAATAPVPPLREPAPLSDRVASLTISPQTVRAGEQATATVTLEGPAPEPAVTVFLGTGSPGVAQVPVVYYIPAGQRSVQFKVTTSASGQLPQDVKLTASSGGATATATLRVQ